MARVTTSYVTISTEKIAALIARAEKAEAERDALESDKEKLTLALDECDINLAAMTAARDACAAQRDKLEVLVRILEDRE